MALDVWVQSEPKLPLAGDGSLYFCSFEDDGCYWFLSPLFEALNEECGQRIDLYGLALFRGNTLDSLERTVAAARRLTAAQPECWDFVREIVAAGVPEESRSTVHRQEVLAMLDKLDSAIAAARETGYYAVFWGD